MSFLRGPVKHVFQFCTQEVLSNCSSHYCLATAAAEGIPLWEWLYWPYVADLLNLYIKSNCVNSGSSFVVQETYHLIISHFIYSRNRNPFIGKAIARSWSARLSQPHSCQVITQTFSLFYELTRLVLSAGPLLVGFSLSGIFLGRSGSSFYSRFSSDSPS